MVERWPLPGCGSKRDAHGGTAGLGADCSTFLIHGDHFGEQRIEHRCRDDRDSEQLYPQGERFEHHGAGEDTEVTGLTCPLEEYEWLVSTISDGVDTGAIVLTVAE